MSEGGGKGGARKIPSLMTRLANKGIDIMDLDVRANNPPFKGSNEDDGTGL